MFFCVLIFFGGLIIAQDTWFKTVAVPVDATKINQATDDLNQIEVDFCEVPGQKTIEYNLKQWVYKKFCLLISNYSDQDKIVNIWFVDQALTNDQWKNNSCQTEERDNVFTSYVTGFQKSIPIKSNSQLKIYPKIWYPSNWTWTMSGCLVYHLGTSDSWGSIQYSILMRRAKFINLNIENDTNIGFVRINYFVLWVLFLFVVFVWIFFKKKFVK